jgi:hypothetical protein
VPVTLNLSYGEMRGAGRSFSASDELRF